MSSISNKISYFLASTECFIFAGSVFGWSSIEYIMKQEGIFMEKCKDSSDLNYNSTGREVDGEYEYCSEALQEYVDVFSWMLISQTFGPLFFGVVSHYCGLFISRTLASLMFSAGVALLSLYSAHSYLILWKEYINISSIQGITNDNLERYWSISTANRNQFIILARHYS